MPNDRTRYSRTTLKNPTALHVGPEDRVAPPAQPQTVPAPQPMTATAIQPTMAAPRSSGATRFLNPANGYTESIGYSAVLWGALFGPIYYAIRGCWGAALLSLFIQTPAVILGGIFLGAGVTQWFGAASLPLACGSITLMWGTFMVPLIRQSYLRRGWQPINE